MWTGSCILESSEAHKKRKHNNSETNCLRGLLALRLIVCDLVNKQILRPRRLQRGLNGVSTDGKQKMRLLKYATCVAIANWLN